MLSWSLEEVYLYSVVKHISLRAPGSYCMAQILFVILETILSGKRNRKQKRIV